MIRVCLLGLIAAVSGAQTQPAGAPAQAPIRGKPPAVGEKAPDFVLDTLDGKKVELAALTRTGPVVLIELRGWVGYQCPVCNAQVRELVTQSKEILGTGAKVVLVYPGPADKLKDHAQEFIAGKGLPEGYHFVIDPDRKFVGSYGLLWNKPGETAYPATFVIDKEGKVRFVKVSDSHAGRSTSAEILKALGEIK